MLERDTPVPYTVRGTFFEALIWECVEPPSHRAFLRVRDVVGGSELFDTGIDADVDHLEELAALATTVRLIIRQLDGNVPPGPLGFPPSADGDPSVN